MHFYTIGSDYAQISTNLLNINEYNILYPHIQVICLNNGPAMIIPANQISLKTAYRFPYNVLQFIPWKIYLQIIEAQFLWFITLKSI